jgi:hypothetical protein
MPATEPPQERATPATPALHVGAGHARDRTTAGAGHTRDTRAPRRSVPRPRHPRSPQERAMPATDDGILAASPSSPDQDSRP